MPLPIVLGRTSYGTASHLVRLTEPTVVELWQDRIRVRLPHPFYINTTENDTTIGFSPELVVNNAGVVAWQNNVKNRLIQQLTGLDSVTFLFDGTLTYGGDGNDTGPTTAYDNVDIDGLDAPAGYYWSGRVFIVVNLEFGVDSEAVAVLESPVSQNILRDIYSLCVTELAALVNAGKDPEDDAIVNIL